MNIINLGILAHIDAGKTSVTENLLFASGATEKCGCVDNGDTITDSMDIEKRRGITVRASTTSIIWNGVKCNIIDLYLIHIYLSDDNFALSSDYDLLYTERTGATVLYIGEYGV